MHRTGTEINNYHSTTCCAHMSPENTHKLMEFYLEVYNILGFILWYMHMVFVFYRVYRVNHIVYIEVHEVLLPRQWAVIGVLCCTGTMSILGGLHLCQNFRFCPHSGQLSLPNLRCLHVRHHPSSSVAQQQDKLCSYWVFSQFQLNMSSVHA